MSYMDHVNMCHVRSSAIATTELPVPDYDLLHDPTLDLHTFTNLPFAETDGNLVRLRYQDNGMFACGQDIAYNELMSVFLQRLVGLTRQQVWVGLQLQKVKNYQYVYAA